MANKQTKATKKYQEKVGLIAKSYKIRKDLAEEFKQACERYGVSQAAQITELMQMFIDQTKEE